MKKKLYLRHLFLLAIIVIWYSDIFSQTKADSTLSSVNRLNSLKTGRIWMHSFLIGNVGGAGAGLGSRIGFKNDLKTSVIIGESAVALGTTYGYCFTSHREGRDFSVLGTFLGSCVGSLASAGLLWSATHSSSKDCDDSDENCGLGVLGFVIAPFMPVVGAHYGNKIMVHSHAKGDTKQNINQFYIFPPLISFVPRTGNYSATTIITFRALF